MSGDTETGAYTITADGITNNSITRNVGATIFLTSEDEWYKAAYYDAVSMSYNKYPFADGFNGAACESLAGTTSHSANCDFAVSDFTDVGAYTASPSASGTSDQAGNVVEWNELIDGGDRGLGGGSWQAPPAFNERLVFGFFDNPDIEDVVIGFRVASVPEPGTGLLMMTALLGLAGVAQEPRLALCPRVF